MAKSPTAMIHELEVHVASLKQQVISLADQVKALHDALKEASTAADASRLDGLVARLSAQLGEMTDRVTRLEERIELLRQEAGPKAMTDLRQEIALVRQLAADQQKRIDKWDTRLWAVVAGVLLFLLSSVVTLVVTLSRK